MADTNSQIRKEIRDAIVSDADLISLLGGPLNVYYRMAPDNSEMPYLVFSLTNRLEHLILSNGFLLMDVWDHSKSSERAEEIVKILKGLLHNSVIKRLGCVIKFVGDDPIDTGSISIQRISLRFEISWVDIELASILGQ